MSNVSPSELRNSASLLLPVLRSLEDGKQKESFAIRSHVQQNLPGVSSIPNFTNWVAWGLVNLQAAVCVRKVGTGKSNYEITERGKSLLIRELGSITLETLRQFPEYLQYLSDNAVRASETRSEFKQ